MVERKKLVSFKKYSDIYEKQCKLFRYNFKYSRAECIAKLSEELVLERVKQFGFKGIPFKASDGYSVLDVIKMTTDDWDNLETRDHYLNAYILEVSK